MKYAKHLASLFLLLAVTAGSVFAFDASATQSVSVVDPQASAKKTTVQNSKPKIALTYSDNPEEPGFYIQTNFHEPSNPNEVPILYRATNGGKFKAYLSSSKVFYSYPKILSNLDNPRLSIEDYSCKNGQFYQYKLATAIKNPATGKSSPVVYSKVKSHYYLTPMIYAHVSYKRSIKKKTITVYWKKQYNCKADGYQIRYNHELTGGKDSKKITRTIKDKHTTKYVLKNCISNRRYFVELRSYKKYKGTTYYGNWSEGRTIAQATLD